MKQIIPPGRLRLGVLASGRGSNFDAICAATRRGDLDAEVRVLVSDRRDAAVLTKADERGIPAIHLDPGRFSHREDYERRLVEVLQEYDVNLVVLAGYMRLVGPTILESFPNRVVNIHPALLPAFTGLNAQRQAVEYGVRFSGCTVHIVDHGMDTGPIIMQAVVPVEQEDDEDTLALRILAQEHEIYWRSLQLLAEGRLWLQGRKVYIRPLLPTQGGHEDETSTN